VAGDVRCIYRTVRGHRRLLRADRDREKFGPVHSGLLVLVAFPLLIVHYPFMKRDSSVRLFGKSSLETLEDIDLNSSLLLLGFWGGRGEDLVGVGKGGSDILWVSAAQRG